MFRNFFCFFGCFSFLFATEQLPELIFRPQTPLEAFSYVENLYSQLPLFKENGYRVALPSHPQFELLHQNTKILSESDKDVLKELFVTQIYDVSLFDLSLKILHELEPLVKQGLDRLSALAKNWDFDIKEKYNILLTLYGPGGSYHPFLGEIILLTTEKGKFGRKCVAETILHEMVHIGIEESIVKKYKLFHCEKERLVDLVCFHYLKEILPEYMMQQIEDKKIDAFVDEQAIIYDLPSAIASFVQQYPR